MFFFIHVCRPFNILKCDYKSSNIKNNEGNKCYKIIQSDIRTTEKKLRRKEKEKILKTKINKKTRIF